MSARLLVVSNRLPVVIEHQDGRWRSRPGSGGLVTALRPVLRRRGGLWIGWPGASEQEGLDLDRMLSEAGEAAGFDFAAVKLTSEERDGFYYGFSNEIVWPLFHGLHTRCNFDPSYWKAYRTVNCKFARKIKEQARDNDFIWVHDYHLMHVAKELREVGLRQKISFFLHIPFPPPEVFLKMPWRFEVLQALLEFDVLGFQTQSYRRNFTQCISSVIPGMSVRGRGRVVTAKTPRRPVQIGVFPISIDFDEFADKAASPEVAARVHEIREDFAGRKLMLGLDRLDYTKGIPERVKAFGDALDRYPELREKLTLVQVVVPSRTAIHEYRDLKSEIEKLVSQVNGRHTVPGWVPIHYVFRNLDRAELTAFYRTADIMSVTPLRDGMNLVAKEYCACRIENDGVLILSEFAGTAATMHRGALLVNPHDQVGMADAVYNAVAMSKSEQQMRMRILRQGVRKFDVFWWLDMFLKASSEQDVELVAPPEEYDLLAILPPESIAYGASVRVPDQ
jgi:alpha,alpha-trehalose-phosphate synthase [UDP-forming]